MWSETKVKQKTRNIYVQLKLFCIGNKAAISLHTTQVQNVISLMFLKVTTNDGKFNMFTCLFKDSTVDQFAVKNIQHKFQFLKTNWTRN